jgi:hypothetical protein
MTCHPLNVLGASSPPYIRHASRRYGSIERELRIMLGFQCPKWLQGLKFDTLDDVPPMWGQDEQIEPLRSFLRVDHPHVRPESRSYGSTKSGSRIILGSSTAKNGFGG